MNRGRIITGGILWGVLLWAGLPAVAQTTTEAPSTTSSPTASLEPLEVVNRLTTETGMTLARLSNGATVILRTTRQMPVVCVQAYVRTGGLYEGPWLGCGISHLTEHLVAKGAVHDMGSQTDEQARQTTDRVDEIGGQSNAYTSLGHTCYYISATSGKTMDCIDLISDWMARPEITREDFEREHGVVQRELEKGKDEPSRQMWYITSENFFRNHPAGVPVIGYPQPLAELTYEDVLAYHRKQYVPQNMVFCVVGDFDEDAVLQRFCQSLAGFAQARSPEFNLPEVPRLTGVQRVTHPNKSVKEVEERICFRTIPLIHPDLYALDVLSYLLTQGQASRLEKSLKREKQLVTSISSSSWTPEWGAGMFALSFRCEPGQADQAEQALFDELKSLIQNGIEEDELARAKRQKVADFVYSQQTVDSVASTLGSDYLSTGDVDFSRRYTDRIQAVTAEEVLEAAKKYFTFDDVLIVRMVPQESQDAEPATQAANLQTADTESADTLITLPNGLRVVLYPSNSVGLVSMAFVSKGGVLLETDETNGLGSLMTALSIKGAGRRSAEQIAEFFDRAGGAIDGNCGNNSLYWQATVLDDSFDEALEILADVVLRPSFEAKELEILRPVALSAIKKQDEEWFGQLSKFFREKFYGDLPYHRLPTGTETVVSTATVEQIADYHRRHIFAGNSVLSICGNFDPAAVNAKLESLFGSLPEGTAPEFSSRHVEVPQSGEQFILKTDNRVAAVMVAVPGMTLQNDDRYALNVLDTIISGWRMPSGWLHTQLRGQQLVYVVHAYNWTGLEPGAFQVYAAGQPEYAAKVVAIIEENLRKASEYEPTQKEIDLAVNAILTAELLGNQAMVSLSLETALNELYGLGYDLSRRLEEHYREVTPAEVLRVGKKYLSGGYVVTVTTPDPDALRNPDGEDANEREE